ncbi:hypothetical protein EV715DRAFT_298263 [Schizophyllum commune]
MAREGEGAARSAAVAVNISRGTSTSSLALSTPSINASTSPYALQSSELQPFLKIQTPLSLKQRISVRRATIFSLQIRFPLRPFLIPASPPTLLGVEATYLFPPSKGPPRSQRVPPPPLHLCVALRQTASPPLGVEATYRRPPSKGLPRSQRVSPSPHVLSAIPFAIQCFPPRR